MVLNLLMRWPSLIVVCALGGAGAVVYDQVDGEQTMQSVRQLVVELKLDRVIPTSQAQASTIPSAQLDDLEIANAFAEMQAEAKKSQIIQASK